ncbi:MAG: hypothetical protein IPP63_19120 [Chloracidobacterium sp.]|nr:hypothetical protein [Chloracidobacterium sp.]
MRIFHATLSTGGEIMGMRVADTVKLALTEVWAHPPLSFLTLRYDHWDDGLHGRAFALQGFNTYVDEKIAGIGSNSFTISRFSFADFGNSDAMAAARRRNKELDLDELEFIRRNARLVGMIGAKASGVQREIRFKEEILSDISITGVEPIVGEIEQVKWQRGRYF